MHVRSRRLAFTTVLLLLLIPAIPGCGGPQPQAPSAPAAARLPDFALQDLSGKTVRLADSKGTVRLVDFWATWCAPCRAEIPTFKEWAKTLGPKGLTLVTIAMDDEGKPVVAPFVRENGIDYTVLLGKPETPDAFGGVVGFPTKFLLDRDGKVVKTWTGAVPREEIESKIREVLGS